MTYKTRQEVLRSAADWMDVCEKAGVVAMCKIDRILQTCESSAFICSPPSRYEFPLALLEGKNVWVGSELYDKAGVKFTVKYFHACIIDACSWNPPKPATVMVEILVEDAKELETWMSQSPFQHRIKIACKKALEKI